MILMYSNNIGFHKNILIWIPGMEINRDMCVGLFGLDQVQTFERICSMT